MLKLNYSVSYRQFHVGDVSVPHQDVHHPVAVLLVRVVVEDAELHVYVGNEEVWGVQTVIREGSAVVALQVTLDDVSGGRADAEDVWGRFGERK